MFAREVMGDTEVEGWSNPVVLFVNERKDLQIVSAKPNTPSIYQSSTEHKDTVTISMALLSSSASVAEKPAATIAIFMACS